MPFDGYIEKSREKIEKNEMNTAGVMQPLLAFNTIVDTNVGLIRLIAMQYRDPSIFNLDYLNKSITIKKLVQDLYNREYKNPLTICSNIKHSELDELYNDFMKNKYKEIIHLSLFTELFNMISIWKKYGGIPTTILCSSQDEIDYLNFFDRMKNVNKVLIEHRPLQEKHPQYIFKSFSDPYIDYVASTLVYDATVYIANYKFNQIGYIKENEEPSEQQKEIMKSPNYIKLSVGRSIIRYIDIYSKQKLYGGSSNDS